MPLKIKLNVSKLDKAHFFKGKSGTYCDLVIWENKEPDQFGNTHSVQQDIPKEARDAGHKGAYVGNGKMTGQTSPAKPAPKAAPKPAFDADLDADSDIGF